MSNKEQVRRVIDRLLDKAGTDAVLIVAGSEAEVRAVMDDDTIACGVPDNVLADLLESNSKLRDDLVTRILDRAAL